MKGLLPVETFNQSSSMILLNFRSMFGKLFDGTKYYQKKHLSLEFIKELTNQIENGLDGWRVSLLKNSLMNIWSAFFS